MKNLIKSAFVAVVLSASFAASAQLPANSGDAATLPDQQSQGTALDKKADEAAKAVMAQVDRDWKAQNPLNEPYDAYMHKDYATAFRLFRPFAEQGNPIAQYYIGLMYSEGNGVTQDWAEAIKWIEKSSEQGNPNAQLVFATMLHGLKYNIQSYEWLIIASANGNKTADDYITKITKEMTPEQIAEAQRLAREWQPTKSEAIPKSPDIAH